MVLHNFLGNAGYPMLLEEEVEAEGEGPELQTNDEVDGNSAGVAVRNAIMQYWEVRRRMTIF